MINIYLDIDESVNVFSWDTNHNPAFRSGYRDYRAVNAGWCNVLVSSELVRDLNDLAAREDVNIIWVSDWFDDAPNVFAPAVGLHGPWEHLTGDPHAVTGEDWWKLKAVREHMERTKPDLAFWAEDLLEQEPAALQWVNTRDELVMVVPEKGVGLSRANLDFISSFLRGNPAVLGVAA